MRKLIARDHEMYKTVSNGKLFDHGSKILYKVTGMSLKENKNHSDLFIYDFTTKVSKKLTTDKQTSSYLSYDNKTILVQRKDGERTLINKINLVTGEETAYFSLDYKVSKLLKISDEYYAFTTKYNTLFDREEFANEQYDDGTPKSKLLDDYYFFDEVKYRSNDDGIINGVRTRLYVYDVNANEATLISDPNVNAGTFDAVGDRLVYTTEDTSNPMAVSMQIHSYNFKTKDKEQLLSSGTYFIADVFCFATGIMFRGYDLRVTHARENSQMYALVNGDVRVIYKDIMDIRSVAGGTDVKLTSGDKFKKVQDKLFLCLCDNGIEKLASMNIEGKIEYVTKGFDYIGGFDIAEDKIVMELMTDVSLTELYLYHESVIEKLTTHNDAALNSVTVSPTEVFTYHSNGYDIKGYVVKPVDMQTGKKYPGVLMIHGGPRGLYTKVYQHRMQVLANAGYFVFYTNPHGSASRGNAFSSIFGKHGETDYEDLMTFTDEVLSRYPELNENKLGVTGHSYGGIMTNVIIGKTNRFAAAVPSASLSNYTTKAFTTDNGLGAGMKVYGDPTENHDWTWQHSPLSRSNQVTTPSLFLHSDADYRCFYADALQMYTALKRYGVDTAMYLFKGEPHGMKKPRNKVKWLEVLQAWFDKYLKN